MKRILQLISIIMLMPLINFAQSDEWITYKCKEGHYIINYPGIPKETAQYDSSGGTLLKINLVEYEIDENTVLMSSWIDMSHSIVPEKSIKQLLEDNRDGAAGALQATNVTTLATNLTGDPYIEFTFSTKEFAGKDRIYFINKFQYSIITIFAGEKDLSSVADKFIGSFKHL